MGCTEVAERLKAARTLCQAIDIHEALHPGFQATWFEGREQTYRQFADNVCRAANAMVLAGVKPGEHIVHVGKNSDIYFELLFAAARIGAVMTPIGWRLTPVEAAWIAQDSEAVMAFIGPECIAAGEAIQSACEQSLLQSVCLEGAAAGMARYPAWKEQGSTRKPSHSSAASDPVLQLYTSGTTGKPKGVMLSHWNLVNTQASAYVNKLGWNEWEPGGASLVAMPNAHIGGSGWGIRGLFHGARNIIEREFRPDEALELIERFSVQYLFMVPAALQIMIGLPNIRRVDYSKLKYILYGASPIPLDLLRECIEIFNCGFCQQYGMTETTGTVCYLPPEDHDVRGNQRMRSAGKPTPGTQIKIIDTSGATLPAHTTGEICIRSESNMLGYWKLDEATRQTLDPEGWIRTGDAGYLDGDGYVYIMDRVKDMIVSGAENVYPAEVESAIYGHPAVSEVAVIGVPDDKWGEAVKALVVLKPGAVADAESIRGFARDQIAGFKVPKTVDFVEEIPRNASGKILKKDLRAPFWAGRDRNVN